MSSARPSRPRMRTGISEAGTGPLRWPLTRDWENFSLAQRRGRSDVKARHRNGHRPGPLSAFRHFRDSVDHDRCLKGMPDRFRPQQERVAPLTVASAVLFGLPMVPDAAGLAALTAEALSAGRLTNGGALHMRLEQVLAADQADGDALSLVSSGDAGTVAGADAGRTCRGAPRSSPLPSALRQRCRPSLGWGWCPSLPMWSRRR